MRHNQNYDKNVCWLKNFKEEHELSAVNLDYSLRRIKNGMQNDKIYARKDEIKILRKMYKLGDYYIYISPIKVKYKALR